MLQHDRFSDDVQLEDFRSAKQAFDDDDTVVCANCQDDRAHDQFIACPHCSDPLCDDTCLHFHLAQAEDCRLRAEVD